MIHLVAPYRVEETEEASLEEAFSYLSKLDVLTVDCETAPLVPKEEWADAGLDPHTSKVVMLQMGDLNRQYVIDTRFVDVSTLEPIFASNKQLKLGVNLKFDIKHLRNAWGFTFFNISDLMINEMVLHQGKKTPKGFYSLEAMARRYLNYEFDPPEQTVLWDHLALKKNIRTTFSLTEPFTKAQVFYGAADVILPFKISRIQDELVRKHGFETATKLENKFTPVLAEIELAGMPFNVEDWCDNTDLYTAKFEAAKEVLDNWVVENYPEFGGINWNSHKQVTSLFKTIGIPTQIVDKDKSSDEETVYKDTVGEVHIAKYSKKFPIIKEYLDYKHLSKLVSSYGLKFLRFVNPVTGRVHSEFRQILNTNRISSSGPNLQNIPGEGNRPGFRKCFNVGPDRALVAADYSSQESRVLADRSKEPSMLDFFLNGDGDMHSFTARRMFKVPVSSKENLDKRRIGKFLNFSIAYGASPHKVADSLSIPIKQAKEFIDLFYAAYPKLKTYFLEQQLLALSRGYVEIDSVTKRVSFQDPMYFEYSKYMASCKKFGVKPSSKVVSKYRALKGEIERNAQNYPIQGTSGNMTKLAAVLFRAWAQGKDAQIVNLVHDEIVVECAKELASEVSSALIRAMQLAGRVFVKSLPMPVGVAISQFWDH